MLNEPRLWFAVDYTRRLIREGEQPARAAACKQTRATLRAEQEARTLRGEQEPTT